MRFLAGGTLLATLVLVAPAWWLGPKYLAVLHAQTPLSIEAWLGTALALTWLLRAVGSLVFLRASGGRLRATARK